MSSWGTVNLSIGILPHGSNFSLNHPVSQSVSQSVSLSAFLSECQAFSCISYFAPLTFTVFKFHLFTPRQLTCVMLQIARTDMSLSLKCHGECGKNCGSLLSMHNIFLFSVLFKNLERIYFSYFLAFTGLRLPSHWKLTNINQFPVLM